MLRSPYLPTVSARRHMLELDQAHEEMFKVGLKQYLTVNEIGGLLFISTSIA